MIPITALCGASFEYRDVMRSRSPRAYGQPVCELTTDMLRGAGSCRTGVSA